MEECCSLCAGLMIHGLAPSIIDLWKSIGSVSRLCEGSGTQTDEGKGKESGGNDQLDGRMAALENSRASRTGLGSPDTKQRPGSAFTSCHEETQQQEVLLPPPPTELMPSTSLRLGLSTTYCGVNAPNACSVS